MPPNTDKLEWIVGSWELRVIAGAGPPIVQLALPLYAVYHGHMIVQDELLLPMRDLAANRDYAARVDMCITKLEVAILSMQEAIRRRDEQAAPSGPS